MLVFNICTCFLLWGFFCGELGMERMQKSCNSWLIGHVRSVKVFATATYVNEFLFIFLFVFWVSIVCMNSIWKWSFVCRKKWEIYWSLYCNVKESGFSFVAEMFAVKKASEASGLNKLNDTTVLPSNEASEKKYVIFLFMPFLKPLVVDKFGSKWYLV